MENKKTKILIIDDNEIIRMMFSNIFWLHGLDDTYELSTVGRADEAQKQIENPSTCPDIIFMGLVMPLEKDGKVTPSVEAGFTIIKQVKENPKLSHIRIIVLSGYQDAEFQQKALDMGVERYLKKSESMPQDILELIRSLRSS
jgi:CheY-like chemotaxis protein